MNAGHKDNGTYIINPTLISGRHFSVYCMFERDNKAAWTVIQRRVNGEVDFNRNWVQYENGFGTLNGSFWLGLWKIHDLTSGRGMLARLYMDLKSKRKAIIETFVEYEEFAVGNSSENYQLHMAKYDTRSSINDVLSSSSKCDVHGMKFATVDKGKESFNGGWWFRTCSVANPNGIYPPSSLPVDECCDWSSCKKYMSVQWFSECYKTIRFSVMRIRIG